MASPQRLRRMLMIVAACGCEAALRMRVPPALQPRPVSSVRAPATATLPSLFALGLEAAPRAHVGGARMVATAAPSPERLPRWRRRWTSFRSRFLMRLRSLLMVALLVGRILAPNGPAIAQPQQQQQRQTASVESRAPAPVRERMAQGVDSFRTHLFTRQEPLDRSPSEDNGSGSGSRSGRSGGSAARTAASSTRRTAG